MRSHLSAVAALLQDAAPGLHVYDTDVSRPNYNPADWSAPWTSADKAAWVKPERWVVLTAPTLPEIALTITAGRRNVDGLVRITAAALDVREMRWLAEKVRNACDPGKPQIAGFEAWINLYAEGIADVAREIEPHVAYAVDTYRYQATPA